MPTSRGEFKAWLRSIGFTKIDFLSAAKVSETTLNKHFNHDTTLHPNTRARLAETYQRLDSEAKVSA